MYHVDPRTRLSVGYVISVGGWRKKAVHTTYNSRTAKRGCILFTLLVDWMNR